MDSGRFQVSVPGDSYPTKTFMEEMYQQLLIFAYAPIFRQCIFRWFLGQVVPLYLSESDTLNLGGVTILGTRNKSSSGLAQQAH